jgi:PAS domain S-box-containing protein
MLPAGRRRRSVEGGVSVDAVSGLQRSSDRDPTLGALGRNGTRAADGAQPPLDADQPIVDLVDWAGVQERDRLLAEWHLLLESAVCGIYRLDRDGRCAYVNPAAARLLGWSPEQLVGDRIHPLIHRHDPDIECPAELALRTGESVDVDEAPLWRADGTFFMARYSCAAVLVGGHATGVVVTFTDVGQQLPDEWSRQVGYDPERIALAKLKELDDAKSNFMATISHELRTPLTSITGYLELLAEGDVGPVSDRQRQVLDTMARNADRLRALIEDLLTVSHVEVRPLVLAPVEIAIHELIEPAIALVHDASRRRGHELSIDLDPSIGPVRVDPAHFRRVLTSLIDNAIRCTLPGGRIEVRATRTANGVEFSVRDNGIGIDVGEVPRLFTRFFRTSAATQLAIQGAGLSLAIARQIVHGHGGSIDVHTAAGEGATFTVSLPI